ncbi:hypothetical protein P7C73_g3581, partial [Tremellales sp. Uapishka_1]
MIAIPRSADIISAQESSSQSSETHSRHPFLPPYPSFPIQAQTHISTHGKSLISYHYSLYRAIPLAPLDVLLFPLYTSSPPVTTPHLLAVNVLVPPPIEHIRDRCSAAGVGECEEGDAAMRSLSGRMGFEGTE